MALIDKLTIAGMSLHEDGKGMTGTRSYLVPAADIFDTSLPVRGYPWPGPPYVLPNLLCVEADWEEEESGLWRAIYHYSTERQLGDEFAEVSMDWGLETVDVTRGYEWEDVETPVQEDIPTQVPIVDYTMRMRRDPPPYDAVRDAINKVNDRKFRGFEEHCLRFDGVSTTESYDLSGEVVSCQSVFKFSGRFVDWNLCWRPPLQARDANGNPAYYQGEDAAAPFYNTALDGQPVYVSGAAGTAGWDAPVLSSSYRYGEADFATVLGLPKLVGDG